ncbi:hypothetical protein GEMRC1_013350 [Eukaryota sp. GEM-RC1]
MTNTVLCELDMTDSDAITLAEVFYLTNTLKKISLSCFGSRESPFLFMFNAISNNSVIESFSTGGANQDMFLPHLYSSSLKRIEFYDGQFGYVWLSPNTSTNLTLTELIFKNCDIKGEVLVQLVTCCTGLRKLVLDRERHTHDYFLPLFKYLEANTSLLELQVTVDYHRDESLSNEEVQALATMSEKNGTLLVLNLDLAVTSSQFLNIVNGLKMNSTLLVTKLKLYALDLNCLMVMFETFTVKKLNCSLDSSTHFIDVDNGVFCFAHSFYCFSTEELSSLQSFLECFNIKELTLKDCRFTKETITALCDLIRSNYSLTSVHFSDFHLVDLTPLGSNLRMSKIQFDDLCFNLTNAIQSNSRLTKVTMGTRDMSIKTLLNIFELVSNNKLTSNIDVAPHLIDFSSGCIRYFNEDAVSDGELVPLLDFLKQNRAIKHFKCNPFQIDTDDDVFCLRRIDLNRPKVTVEVVSSLRSFSIKKLTLKDCEFTKESITALCDLIRSSSSLTSVDFSDFSVHGLKYHPDGRADLYLQLLFLLNRCNSV